MGKPFRKAQGVRLRCQGHVVAASFGLCSAFVATAARMSKEREAENGIKFPSSGSITNMTMADLLDRQAIAAACRKHGARRLQVFGSATTDRFEPGRSDIDFLVDFSKYRQNAYDTYFGLKEDLEMIVGAKVDLVVEYAIKNPYFKSLAYSQAVEVYAS